MQKLHFIFLFVLFHSSFNLCAQNNSVEISTDSLKTILKSIDEPDSIYKIYAAILWGDYLFSNTDSALFYSDTFLNFAKENGNIEEIAKAHNSKGISFMLNGDLKNSEIEYKNALKYFIMINDLPGILSTNNNLGAIYYYQGNYVDALDSYNKSVKLANQLKDYKKLANSYNEIGGIYYNVGDLDKALEFYTKSFDIRNEHNFSSIFDNYANIANVYSDKGEYEKALDYYFYIIENSDKVANKKLFTIVDIGIGIVYTRTKEFEKAKEYLEKSLEESLMINDKIQIVYSYLWLGKMYYESGNYQKAIDNSLQAFNIAKNVNLVLELKESSETLYKSYRKLNKYKETVEMVELYLMYNDSMAKEDNLKELFKLEVQNKYEIKATKDSINFAAKEKLKEIEIENQNNVIKNKQKQQYYLYAIILLTIISLGFIYNRFKLSQKQKNIITLQKNEVESQKYIIEEKQKEILDSINYAKRIQNAILPSDTVFRETFPNAFVLYLPKDIVAGDFYFLEKSENTILLAAADCTGHGVPGAMVSVVCNNALNRSIREYGLTNPGEILDKTREIVVKEFEKSDDNVKDGMDISLISFAHRTESESDSEEKNALRSVSHSVNWSGANNPLWIIRKDNLIIEEIKADKQPIGHYTNEKPFNTHTIELEKGDTIYLLTDGLQDQFGGEKGKKFKPSNLKSLLLSIQHLNMDEQKLFINDVFEKWKGDIEQVDDVCIIGVRV